MMDDLTCLPVLDQPVVPSRITRIFEPGYVICRDDVLLVLHYVQQKVALEDPLIMNLPKPRLITNFQYFSEAAMLLLGERTATHSTQERLKTCLHEAIYGLRGEMQHEVTNYSVS
ncbi:hypothetical protein [Paenibacillus sp. Marseille-Q4541]|uniref:hypothetical protein n=1 Tax=Paenibacillus sp. Marseille-Q4541 TaxID=2831522 RepID=UPI001BA983C5|nr:hypothetical protein [Paenibacillus sp. Marseille-Q4541]